MHDEYERSAATVIDPDGTINWITITEAADLTGLNKGIISSIAGKDQMTSKGTGKDRRVEGESILALAQARQKEQGIRGEAKEGF